MKAIKLNLVESIKHIPLELKVSDKVCIWEKSGDCKKSGLRDYLKKEVYDGVKCKCFAYTTLTYKNV